MNTAPACTDLLVRRDDPRVLRVQDGVAPGPAAGDRFYGHWPMASHALLEPAQVGVRGLIDGAAHRQGLSPLYNTYARVVARDGESAEALEAVAARIAAGTPWMAVQPGRGAAEVEAVWRDLVLGRSRPDIAHVLSLGVR